VVVVFHAFAHLFVRIIVNCYTSLGTSPGGIGAQAVLLILTEVKGGWWRMQNWRDNWRGGLRCGVLTLGVVWAGTFAVCTVTTVYDDHVALVARNEEITVENRNLRARVATLQTQAVPSRGSLGASAIHAPWQLSAQQRAKLLGLLYAPCEKMKKLERTFREPNPPIKLSPLDDRDPDVFHLATQLKEMFRVAGCDVPIEPATKWEAGLGLEPFFGIKVWDGRTERTREAARLLQGAFMQVMPDTGLVSGAEAIGQYEGIAVLVGKRPH
jgi:hypothetical protein